MKLFRYISVYIIPAIILISLLVFVFMVKTPAQKVLDEFLEHINGSDNVLLNKYIVPELQSDPFLDALFNQNIIINHKTSKPRKNDHRSNKINTLIFTENGAFEVPFIVSKYEGQWLISQFPRVNNIGAAIPFSVIKKSSKATEYKFDVEGTQLTCILPSPKDHIDTGVPTSLVLIEDYIAKFQPLTPINLNKIKSSSKEHIEDALLGNIPIESSLGIYELSNNTPIYMKRNILPIGITNVTLYRSTSRDNKDLVAYINLFEMPRDIIRVVLNDSGFNSLLHENLTLSSNGGMKIKNLVEDLEYDIPAYEKVDFKYDLEKGSLIYHKDNILASSSNRWYISPQNSENLIINSLTRVQSQGSTGTAYRGSMEICSRSGGLVLVNEVSLEEYLYSVVPSEMPIKFGLESLKVQAIAARSYAVKCLESVGFASLGAHVDDSVSSQVYNNINELPIAIQAVHQTKGLVPVFDDKIIDARFFSTSYGYTANFHEVWSVDDSFPSIEIPYLISRPQFVGDVPSLYNEENFRSFINNENLQGYDRFSPFFRWSLTMKKEQIEALVQRNLAPLQTNQPLFVLTRQNDGSFNQQPIPEDLGLLQNITPLKRGQGGNIMELELTTTRGIYKIIKELNIRQLLEPVNLVPGENPMEVKRHDGSIVKDFPILPSAFFYIDIDRDSDGDITHVNFIGGGYGHGVGMSQYGVYGLSLLGKTYEEIIEQYYPRTELHNLY